MIGAQASSFLASRPLAAMFPAGMSRLGMQNWRNMTDDATVMQIKGNGLIVKHNARDFRGDIGRWLKPRVW